MSDRLVMPVSHDGERAILGGILLENECYPEAVARLQLQDFSLESHRRIFAAMAQLGAGGKPIDTLTITNNLAESKQLEHVGGATYIASLTEGLPRRSTVNHFIEIVRSRAQRRQVIHACTSAMTAAADVSSELSIASIHEALLSIEAANTHGEAKHICLLSDEVFNGFEKMRAHTGEIVGLRTGISSLDMMTTGIRAGEFWVLGGRPGDGKSTLALQCAYENARREVPVVVYTLEMNRHQVLTRLWSQYTGIPFAKLRDPRKLTQDEHAHLKRGMGECARMPVFIDDSGSLTVRELAARARLLIKREKIKLVIVDYIQLLDADGKDERQRVTRISNTLRELAKEGVPVLALSQLARPKDSSLNTRPNKFSLKESGSLEADADTIVLIYRPVNNHDEPTGQDELIIAKQRSGPLSLEPVWFDEKTLRFRERQIVKGRAQ